MARRRMISEEMLIDEDFNSLSIRGQNLFLRMLAKSDDCGVIPASEYWMVKALNLPEEMRNLDELLEEIVTQKMGVLIEWDGKKYFLFKSKSFLKYQSYIINKRQKSEYLEISAEEFDRTDFGNGKAPAPVKSGRFQKPTIQEVKEVMQEYNVNDFAGEAEKFWHFYEAKGWKVGRSPMVKWKSAVAGWVKRSNLGRKKEKCHHCGKSVDNLAAHIERACEKVPPADPERAEKIIKNFRFAQ